MACEQGNPGITICKAPHYKRCAVHSKEACTQHPAIYLGLCDKLLPQWSEIMLNLHIHLCDLHFQSQGRETVHIGKHVLGIWVGINAYMHLQTHTINWHTTLEESLQQVINRLRFPSQS